jgi:tRNA uridine 5-carbamoylmethylation protein Kti12
VQLYLPLTLDAAQERNRQRPPGAQQPAALLARMAVRLEPPDPATRPWEAGTVVVRDADADAGAADPAGVLGALVAAADDDVPRQAAWQQAQQRAAGRPREQEEERARLCADTVHMADVALRHACGRVVRAGALSPAAAAAAKARALAAVRDGIALPAPPSPPTPASDAAWALWADRQLLGS